MWYMSIQYQNTSSLNTSWFSTIFVHLLPPKEYVYHLCNWDVTNFKFGYKPMVRLELLGWKHFARPQTCLDLSGRMGRFCVVTFQIHLQHSIRYTMQIVGVRLVMFDCRNDLTNLSNGVHEPVLVELKEATGLVNADSSTFFEWSPTTGWPVKTNRFKSLQICDLN